MKNQLFQFLTLSLFTFYFALNTCGRLSAQSIERIQFSGLAAGNNLFQPVAGTAFGSYLPATNGSSLTVSSEYGKGTFVPLSVQQDAQVPAGLRVFPNPVSEVLQIEWQGREGGELRLLLLDASGRQIKEHLFRGKESSMSLRGLPVGNYRLQPAGKPTSGWNIIKK